MRWAPRVPHPSGAAPRQDIYPVAQHIIEEFAAKGRNQAVISMTTVMELLVCHAGDAAGASHRARLHPEMRAAHLFSPPDALVVGTGLATQVGHLVTNDYAWQTRLAPLQGRITVCVLAKHLPFPERPAATPSGCR